MEKKQVKPVLWSADDILQATGGEWISGSGAQVEARGISYYFYHIRRGDLFVMTSPEEWGKGYADTGRKLSQLAERGVAAAIVSRRPERIPDNLPLLLVENTRQALDALGQFARERFQGKVICVTGTVGKSTVKEGLRFVLGRQAATGFSRKNFNHGPGVSLSLAQTPPGAAYGVFEFAVDKPSVTLRKALIARPHVAIITNIEQHHLDFYATLDELAAQKALLFDGLVPGGTAILNRDNGYYTKLLTLAQEKGVGKIMTFGFHPEADVRATVCELRGDGSRVEANVAGEPVAYRLGQPGKHVIANSLAVLAGVAAVQGDIRRAAADLCDMPLLGKHAEFHRIEVPGGYFELIDDSYSANPASIRAGLEVLRLQSLLTNKRRIAVLGDICNLGKHSAAIHAALARDVIDAGIDKLFTFGEQMRNIRSLLPDAILCAHGATSADLAGRVAAEVRAGDIVLVKCDREAQTSSDAKLIVDALLAKGRPFLGTRVSAARNAPALPFSPLALELDRKGPKQLELVFAGDTSFGENYQQKDEKRGYGNVLTDLGYDYPLQKMKAFLLSADMCIANLETPLTDLKSSPFQDQKTFIHWSDMELAPRHLLKHNIQVVGLANNHSFDYGRPGFEQTLAVLERAGMYYFGGGRNQEEACRPLILETLVGQQPFRLALLGAYEFSEEVQSRYGCYARGSAGGASALGQETLEQIAALRKADPRLFIIVLPHWGRNYRWKNGAQSRMADALIEAGADLVLGHGAHMLQEIEPRQGRWVVFSLGNFMFNSRGRYAQSDAPPYSLLARLIVRAEGDLLRRGLHLYPIVTDNLRTGYQTRFVTEQEFAEVQRLLQDQSRDAAGARPSVSCGEDAHGRYLELDLGAV